MSLTFPTSPANGDTYSDGTRNFTWNGITWNVSSSDAPTNKNYVDSHEPAIVDGSPPTQDANNNAAKEGDLWYDTTSGRLYVLYDDGSSIQWVDASPAVNDTDTHSFIGNAAPTLTTRPDNSPLLDGDMYIDTSTGDIFYHETAGGTWVGTSGGAGGGGGASTDLHAIAGSGAPLISTRPDNSALQNGDMYIDDTTGVVYYYNFTNSSWELIHIISPDTHSFVVNGVPTMGTRPDGTALLAGDTAIDDATNNAYFYDGSNWLAISGGTPTIWSNTAPTVNNVGLPLVNGDLWSTDTMDMYGYHGLKVYHTNAWHDIGTADTHAFVDTGAPVLTARPDGSDLLNGDLYIDDTTHTVYYYDLVGAAWVATAGGGGGSSSDTHSFVDTGAPVLTTRPGGSALENGDLYVDDATDQVYWYDLPGTSWMAIAGGSSSGGQIAVGDTPPTANVEGDQWYDVTTARTYVYLGDDYGATAGSEQWVDASPSYVDVEATLLDILPVATDDSDADTNNIALGGLYKVATPGTVLDIRVRLV